MKLITAYLREALGSQYEGDELRTVIAALCREGLGLSEHVFYLNETITLDAGQRLWLDDAVRRLQKGEPLQYVLGTALFAGLALKVDGRVLIPRPETAGLVEKSVECIERSRIQRECHSTQRSIVLDVGTGSGCIAIALATSMSGISVTATDVSERALEVARENARAAGTDVTFIRADMKDVQVTAGLLPRGCAGIVSNPPYVRWEERMLMEPRVTEWEPDVALFVPDDDPLVCYRAIAQIGQTEVLRAGGWIAVETNSAFAYETAMLFTLWGYNEVQISEDLYGLPRYVTCWKG